MDVDDGEIKLEYNPNLITYEEIINRINQNGFHVREVMTLVIFMLIPVLPQMKTIIH